MKVGISITPDYVRLQDIPLYAEKAEKAGFHSVWIPEHFMYGETFTLLSAAAGRTNRVGLGTGIISIYTRHPALTAMAISTLQTLSGGRAMLGIGIGGEHWMRECFGYSLRGSVDALREGVSLVRSILRGGDVNFRGAHFRAVGLSIHSRGVPPPIYVAAVGPRALRVAGEVGDGVIFSAFSSVSYIRKSIKIVKDACREAGRDYSKLEYAAMVATANYSEEGMRSLRNLAATYLSWHMRGERVLDEDARSEVDLPKLRSDIRAGRLDRAGDRIGDRILNEIAAAGERKHVIGQLRKFQQAGLTLPILYPIGSPDSAIELFPSEVT